MDQSSLRRWSTVPLQGTGLRHTWWTLPPINCGTWTQMWSTRSRFSCLDQEREGQDHQGHRWSPGLNVLVSSHSLSFYSFLCLLLQRLNYVYMLCVFVLVWVAWRLRRTTDICCWENEKQNSGIFSSIFFQYHTMMNKLSVMGWVRIIVFGGQGQQTYFTIKRIRERKEDRKKFPVIEHESKMLRC